ncbi:hypothetical protein HOY82DRAFT_575803 [Tuber indicum]|nr:hypothetical protein HOY82DRAFT_575803 [Tuber indicum]
MNKCNQHFALHSTVQLFNKVYLIRKSYIFRATLPVKPLYKTASEVATLRLLRQFPEVFADDCTTENELGFEWIIMENVTGGCLREFWHHLSLERKAVVVEHSGQLSKELRGKCRFGAVGSLYQHAELSEGDLKVAVVNSFIFAGKWKPLMKRDRGPYRSDSDYLLASTKVELEDRKLLLKLVSDKGAAGVQKAHLNDADSASDQDDPAADLQEILTSLFFNDMQTTEFVLHHHDLSHSNVMVDHTTLEITGIVDWECITTPLALGDTYECCVERWERWENTEQSKTLDQAAGSGANNDKDGWDKRGVREQLDLLEFSTKVVKEWIAPECPIVHMMPINYLLN